MKAKDSFSVIFKTTVPIFLLLGLISCGSYQGASYYRDGVYESSDTQNLATTTTESTPVAPTTDYKQYFSDRANAYQNSSKQDAIFTDVEGYSSSYTNENEAPYENWGENAVNNIDIHVYNDPFFYPQQINPWYNGFYMGAAMRPWFRNSWYNRNFYWNSFYGNTWGYYNGFYPYNASFLYPSSFYYSNYGYTPNYSRARGRRNTVYNPTAARPYARPNTTVRSRNSITTGRRPYRRTNTTTRTTTTRRATTTRPSTRTRRSTNTVRTRRSTPTRVRRSTTTTRTSRYTPSRTSSTRTRTRVNTSGRR